MKKQVLLTLASALTISIYAQQSNRSNQNLTVKRVETFKSIRPEPQITGQQNKSLKKVSAITYKRIASSSNVYGLVATETRCLQYNKDLNLVSFISRVSSTSTVSIPNGVQLAWSSNNGSMWDSTILAANSTKFLRYPAGSVYNPTGNTTPSNAYSVFSGPWHPGTNWQGNYFGSKKLTTPFNATGGNITYIDNSALMAGQKKEDFARTSPQVTSDGKAHVLGGLYTDINSTTASGQAFRGVMLNYGTFNTGTSSFTWTVDSLKPNFKNNSTGVRQSFGIFDMAWSEDGVTGYVIFSGIDANAVAGTSMNSFQPYVYKTINSGTTWSRYAPLFNFSTIPSVSDRLFPTKGVAGNLLKPFISFSEGVSSTVDANGNLHLFTSMVSGSSDNIDSLNFTFNVNFNQVWNYIYDFKTTGSGWNAVVVDSLNNNGPTSNATAVSGTGNSNWTSSTGPIDYDARLQISRTPDGKYIFYSWADSDSLAVPIAHTSSLPDIYMRGYDVTNNKMTCKKNMSRAKTGVAYYSYFFFASPIVSQPTSSSFLIPTTIARSSDNNGDNPIDHIYINDNTFTVSEFSVSPTAVGCESSTGVGIKDQSSSAVSGLKFYPNPASTSGTLEITLHDNSKMEISILNNVGQVVYTTSVAGNAGTNTVELNLSNLSSGMYFYQVKTGNTKTITNKFIVTK